MTQTPELGLSKHDSPEPSGESWLTPNAVVAIVLIAGLLSLVLVALWSQTIPLAADTFVPSSPLPLIGYVLLAMTAEIVYYPVRRSDSNEELSFFEIWLMCGVLVLPAVIALVGSLLGLILAEIALSRTLTKALFNIGSIAVSTSILVMIYQVVSGDSPRFSLASIVALLLGALAFVFTNLLLLAWILRVADGIPARNLIREQWSLSAGVAIVGVGVATSAVALWEAAPPLVVFSLVPAAALWYAYGSSAAHTQALERSRWMLEVGATLVTPAAPNHLVPQAASAIRQVFGADDVLVVLDDKAFAASSPGAAPSEQSLTDTNRDLAASSAREIKPIRASLLPPGWIQGSIVSLEVDSPGPAAMALGACTRTSGLAKWLPWARGAWHLTDVDRPVLTTLAASLASAIRASQRLQALRDETAKLTAVVGHATDGIAVVDGQGRIGLWSPAMATITGVPEDRARASRSTGADEPVLEQFRKFGGVRAEPSSNTFSVSIERVNGELRELQVSVVAIEDDEALTVLTVRDMTHERRVERMKSDFIATVSHELRTPITPIKGYAQLLSNRWDRMAEAKRTDVLATIVDRADHLSRLVDDLLLASRVADIESARLDVDLADVDLMGMVQESARAFPDLATRLTVSGPTATVRCDRVRAIQCVANLIGNAGKYSAAESPIGVVTGTSEGGRWAVVDVVDRGRGIPADELDKVFERFYRVEDPMTMTTSGSGLGLFISRELARAMGGDITVESTLNEGSRFTLTLPISNGESQS